MKGTSVLNIILIYLPHPYLLQPGSHAPLGLMYIASSLKNKGEEVIIKNYTSFHMNEAIDDLPEADVYGITVTSLELLQSNDFARLIKNKYPKSIVGLGGAGTFTDDYVDFNVIDFICKGDGELTVLKIIDDIKNNKLQKKYKGETIEDLDSLSFPARHLLSKDQGGNIFAYNEKYTNGGTTMIVSSRGCPFKCSFCSSPYFTHLNKGVRYRSPNNVVDEIKYVINNYNINQFKFCDEMFTSNRKRVFEICDLLENLDIAWKASVRVKPFDYDMAKAMKSSGCKEISFGVESFDNDVLKVLNKKTKDLDNARALEVADMAGIKTRILFMIRTPGQTKYTVNKNIEWLEKVPYHIIACTSFIPIPGSDTWNNPDKYNIEILNKNLNDYNFYFYGNSGEDHNTKDIIKIKDRSLDEFNKESIKFREYLDNTGKIHKG
jgi:anaerobic magnesium-protoporphyrin IX monomethyl ester cyclase